MHAETSRSTPANASIQGSGSADKHRNRHTDRMSDSYADTSVSCETHGRISPGEIMCETVRNSADFHHFFSKYVRNAAKRQLLLSGCSDRHSDCDQNSCFRLACNIKSPLQAGLAPSYKSPNIKSASVTALGMLKGACWLADIVWLKDFAVEVQVNVGFILQVGYMPALHSLSGGRVICLKCFHIFSSIGLPPSLRFLWAGASGSDMAATVAVSRTAAN